MAVAGNLKSGAWLLAAALGVATGAVQAEDKPAVEFAGSGFMTLGLGQMLGGSRGNVGDYECPCFTSDYAQAGVFDGRNGVQWKPDSKVGVQGVLSMDNRRLALTAQAVARGARDGRINLEWFYGSYKVNGDLTVQLGRKRLPMFYYSETQDIGVTLPWAHLPPQLYGWDAVNYNGANVMIRKALGDWSATLNLMAGTETFKDSGYYKIYSGRQSKTDVRWKNIVGGDLVLSRNWLEARLVFLQSDTETRIVEKGTWNATTGTYDATAVGGDWRPQPPFKQRIHGIAVNADYHDWLVRSELIRIDRPGQSFRDYASIFGVGHRIGKWQPMVTHSRYWGKAVVDRNGNPADPTALEGHYTLAFTLRYDLSTSSAIKLQYDRQVDQSGPNWGIGSGGAYGNANLLTVTYDMVF